MQGLTAEEGSGPQPDGPGLPQAPPLISCLLLPPHPGHLGSWQGQDVPHTGGLNPEGGGQSPARVFASVLEEVPTAPGLLVFFQTVALSEIAGFFEVRAGVFRVAQEKAHVSPIDISRRHVRR